MGEPKYSRRSLVLAGIPVALAFLFALVRPAWLAGAVASADEGRAPSSSGIGFSLGGGGPIVDVKRPTRGRIAEVIHAPATIRPGAEVEVGAPFEGKVAELVVDEGAVVSANDVLFRLDPIEYDDKKREAELELARRKAALAESEAELREAEHKLDEAKGEPSPVTEARLKIRQSELARDRAQAELDNAFAKLARARDMLRQGVGKQDDVDAADAERRVQVIALHIAEEELRLARETLSFREKDAKDTLVSCQKAYDTAKTHVTRARADVTAGQVALDRADRDRAECDVRTPISGVITQRNVNEGSLVVRGDGGTVGTATQVTPYIVSDMAHMLAYADVEEGDVAKVREGQTAWVRVNALGDELRLRGKVIDVANRAQQKANEDTKSFRVRVLISERDDRLRPDMSANVDVETRVTGDDAIRVPLQAVLQKAKRELPDALVAKLPAPVRPGAQRTSDESRNDERIDVVFALVDGKVDPRIVTLGPSDGENVAITAGVAPTDWIVVGPFKTLAGIKAGDQVVANYKDSPDGSSTTATAPVSSGTSGVAADEKRSKP